MAEAVGGGGETRCDTRVDVRGVARIGPHRVVAEQGGEELVVGDGLDLRGHDLACLLVDFLVGQRGVVASDPSAPIVLAHEQRVQRRQLDVLVGPNVAGQESWSSVTVRMLALNSCEWQQIAVAGPELPAVEGAQRRGGRHRSRRRRPSTQAVIPLSCCRGLWTDSGRRIVVGPIQRNCCVPEPSGSKNTSPLGTEIGTTRRGARTVRSISWSTNCPHT